MTSSTRFLKALILGLALLSIQPASAREPGDKVHFNLCPNKDSGMKVNSSPIDGLSVIECGNERKIYLYDWVKDDSYKLVQVFSTSDPRSYFFTQANAYPLRFDSSKFAVAYLAPSEGCASTVMWETVEVKVTPAGEPSVETYDYGQPVSTGVCVDSKLKFAGPLKIVARKSMGELDAVVFVAGNSLVYMTMKSEEPTPVKVASFKLEPGLLQFSTRQVELVGDGSWIVLLHGNDFISGVNTKTGNYRIFRKGQLDSVVGAYAIPIPSQEKKNIYIFKDHPEKRQFNVVIRDPMTGELSLERFSY